MLPMKNTSRHVLTAVVNLAMASPTAVRSLVHDRASDIYTRVLSRRSLQHKTSGYERRIVKTSQENEHEAQDQDGTSHWWLDKQSSEKDIVYIANNSTAGNGKNIFTSQVDTNPDTSGLPYRAPSSKPTERPMPLRTKSGNPTESSSVVTIEIGLPQDVDKAATSKREKTYHYPIWADSFKGCTTSTSAPEAYISNPSEYLFPSISTCCEFWFEYQICTNRTDRDVSMVMYYDGYKENVDENGDMDKYMFHMNGIEAYCGDRCDSEDYGSGDEPTLPPTSGNTYFPTLFISPTESPVSATTKPTPSARHPSMKKKCNAKLQQKCCQNPTSNSPKLNQKCKNRKCECRKKIGDNSL